MNPRLSGLFIYPIKGCRGLSLTEGRIDALGLVDDRRYMVVEPDGTFLTQRTLPRMALIEPQLTVDGILITGPGFPALSLPRAIANVPLLKVRVWKSADLSADDCGDTAATWLTDFLERPARLVRIGAVFERPIIKSTGRPGDVVTFADAYPFMALSESSLDDLNDRMAVPLPMDRFRPNFVFSHCEEYAEDTWPRLKIGDVIFRAGGPCARCVVTTTDQRNGQRESPEPLRTLATYRRDPLEPSNVNFGQNLIHETKAGVVRIGDPVELLS
jgi:uncharacterized protein YcbX